MTERIDHAAKALKIMHDVGTDERGEIPLELFDSHEQWIYDATMREAQVHATLAIVAELRTANIIAARAQSEFPRIDLRDGNSWETVQLETDERIRERLGLS